MSTTDVDKVREWFVEFIGAKRATLTAIAREMPGKWEVNRQDLMKWRDGEEMTHAKRQRITDAVNRILLERDPTRRLVENATEDLIVKMLQDCVDVFRRARVTQKRP